MLNLRKSTKDINSINQTDIIYLIVLTKKQTDINPIVSLN